MSNTTISPSAGVVNMLTQHLAVALSAVLSVTGIGSSMDQGVSPTSGSVSSIGISPPLSGGVVSPPSGNLSLVSSGSILGNILASGGAYNIALTGLAPAFGSGSAPTIDPGLASLSGGAPQLFLGSVLADPGLLSLNGNVPTLSVPNNTLTISSGGVIFIGLTSSPTSSIFGVTGQWNLLSDSPPLNSTIVLGSAGTGPVSFASTQMAMDLGLYTTSGQVLITTIGIRSPVVSPSSGSIVMTGLVPSAVPSAPVIQPATAALAISSPAPSVSLGVPSPPCAALVLGGQIPVSSVEFLLIPGSISVTFTGIPPSGTGTTVSKPIAAQLQWISSGQRLSWTLNTSTGLLGISGFAKPVTIGTVIAPTVGAVVDAGSTLTLVPGVSNTPSVGSVSISGLSPTQFPADVVTTGAVSIAGAMSPMGVGISPNSTAVLLTSVPSTINGRSIIEIPSGAISEIGAPSQLATGIIAITGQATVSGAISSSGIGVSPRAGDSLFDSEFSVVSLSGLPLTQAGDIALSGARAFISLGMSPRSTSAVFESALPLVNSLTTIVSITGSVSFDSDSSRVRQPGVIIPNTEDLILSSDAQQIIRSGYAAPPTAALFLSARDPRVTPTTAGYCTPATGAVILVGQPAVNALYDTGVSRVVLTNTPSQYSVQITG